MIYQVFDTSTSKLVATILDRDLDCATKNAKNQASLFNRDVDAIFVCADPDPKPHKERDRFGFAWLDGGEGEGHDPR